MWLAFQEVQYLRTNRKKQETLFLESVFVELKFKSKERPQIKTQIHLNFFYIYKKSHLQKNQYWNLFVHRQGLRYNVIPYDSVSCCNQGIHVPVFVTRISDIQHLDEIMIFETNGSIFNFALPKAFSRFRMVT